MTNGYIKQVVQNADHVERINIDEYVVTIVDARDVENKVIIKKYLSGFTCQWSMTVNNVKWIYNSNIDEDVIKFFDWLSDKAFTYSEEERQQDRASVETFFANL